tara:strand:+ start:73859 stop:74056 length:198 start_codon:yes stop_codon:yes gene_type:complete
LIACKLLCNLSIQQKIKIMEKNEKNLEQEKQSKKEQAINKSATQGKNINYQEKERKEKHQPRDTA